MDKRSASIVAGMLVAALMAGVVSRDLTLKAPAPIQVVVQTPGTAAAAPSASFAEPATEG